MPNPWATFWTAMTVQRLYFWCAWKGESSGIVRFLPRDWCILSLWDCSANREIFMISWAVLWSLWDCSAGLACYCIHNGRRLPVTMHLFLAFSCIGIVTSNIVALLRKEFHLQTRKSSAPCLGVWVWTIISSTSLALCYVRDCWTALALRNGGNIWVLSGCEEKHQLVCQSLRLFKKTHSWTVFHETSDSLLCLETSICWDWACCLSWHVWHRHDLRQRWGTQTYWKILSGSVFLISAARAAPLAMESVSSSSALRSVVFWKGARS